MPAKLGLLLRLIVGGVFLVSGTEKLTGPHQNFLFVIQNYELLPVFLEEITARLFPWVEFFTGLFLVLGLWTRTAMQGSFLLSLIFMITVSQALIRKLPVTECGCFGELISVPLYVVLCIDITLCLCSTVMLRNHHAVQTFSLDAYFEKK